MVIRGQTREPVFLFSCQINVIILSTILRGIILPKDLPHAFYSFESFTVLLLPVVFDNKITNQSNLFLFRASHGDGLFIHTATEVIFFSFSFYFFSLVSILHSSTSIHIGLLTSKRMDLLVRSIYALTDCILRHYVFMHIRSKNMCYLPWKNIR